MNYKAECTKSHGRIGGDEYLDGHELMLITQRLEIRRQAGKMRSLACCCLCLLIIIKMVQGKQISFPHDHVDSSLIILPMAPNLPDLRAQ